MSMSVVVVQLLCIILGSIMGKYVQILTGFFGNDIFNSNMMILNHEAVLPQ